MSDKYKYARYLLAPFALIYSVVMWTRNLFYDMGIFHSKKYGLPVIVFGNLSTGGTGKSPHTEYLARKLSHKYVVAILSRGYGRKTHGFIVASNESDARQIGDEPYMIHRKNPDITLAVDEDRAHGISHLQSLSDVIIMDDAYQHRRVKASCYFLLTSYYDPFFKDFILPMGNLRESRLGSRRCSAVIVTKCPDDISKRTKAVYRKRIARYTDKPVLFSHINYSPKVCGRYNRTMPLEKLLEYEILLVTGIANPRPMCEYLSDRGIEFDHLRFSDHRDFTHADIRKINEAYEDLDELKKIILTTEKDFVRLEPLLSPEIQIYSLPIEVRMSREDRTEFDRIVHETISGYCPDEDIEPEIEDLI